VTASQRGVVLASGSGGVWRVRLSDGTVVDASMRGRLKKAEDARAREARQRHEGVSRGSRRRDDAPDDNALKLTVGDDVQLERDASLDSWTISEIMPRRSQLARRAPGGAWGERIVAANVDQVLIVFAAAQPEPHVRMLDRFLVIAEANALAARIVINKSDLVDAALPRQRFADYDAAGYPVHVTSTRTGRGLEQLHDVLVDRTTALSGPSGVGKSSLMNAMFPGLDLRVGEISQSVNKGRHTTVGAHLHALPDGGFVVDTPGLREVGMWGLEPAHLDRHFPEFRPYVDQCRFADCTHRVEPDCAVRDALADGRVSPARVESYVKLLEELEHDATVRDRQ
jgi:ribosome biogenesis GTPase / thiamine phosphate phosphatase